MRDPKEELRDYLGKLVYRYLNIKSIYRELQIIDRWMEMPNVQVVTTANYFLNLVIYSFWRIILVELAMLLSGREEKSLLDWLMKAKEHASKLQPMRYNPRAAGGEYKPIPPRQYLKVIDRQIAQVNRLKPIIERVKAHRDKAIAHLDAKYFNTPEKLSVDFPLGDQDISALLKLVECILETHYLYLFRASVTLEVASASTVESLFRYAEAFLRARTDKDLIAKGFRPADYFVDRCSR